MFGHILLVLRAQILYVIMLLSDGLVKRTRTLAAFQITTPPSLEIKAQISSVFRS